MGRLGCVGVDRRWSHRPLDGRSRVECSDVARGACWPSRLQRAKRKDRGTVGSQSAVLARPDGARAEIRQAGQVALHGYAAGSGLCRRSRRRRCLGLAGDDRQPRDSHRCRPQDGDGHTPRRRGQRGGERAGECGGPGADIRICREAVRARQL